MVGASARTAIMAVGTVLLVGSVADLSVLWLAQRQPTLQWEFVAATNTLAGMVQTVLGLGLLTLGAHLNGPPTRAVSRALGAGFAVVALAGFALGILTTLDYLALVRGADAATRTAFTGTVVKAAVLAALYVAALTPAAWSAFRKSDR